MRFQPAARSLIAKQPKDFDCTGLKSDAEEKDISECNIAVDMVKYSVRMNSQQEELEACGSAILPTGNECKG